METVYKVVDTNHDTGEFVSCTVSSYSGWRLTYTLGEPVQLHEEYPDALPICFDTIVHAEAFARGAGNCYLYSVLECTAEETTPITCELPFPAATGLNRFWGGDKVIYDPIRIPEGSVFCKGLIPQKVLIEQGRY